MLLSNKLESKNIFKEKILKPLVCVYVCLARRKTNQPYFFANIYVFASFENKNLSPE